MLVQALKELETSIREPFPYAPVVTEISGAANMAIGSTQMLIGKWLQNQNCSILAHRHIQQGIQTFRFGLVQFLPGFAVCMGLWFVLRQLEERQPF